MSVSGRDKIAVPRIDLVFDRECPNVDDARRLLRAALVQAGVPATWREWEREAADTPPALRGLGSPTILVDGADVSGADAVDSPLGRANCCRVYHNDDRLRGVPALEAVTTALSRGRTAT